MNKQWISSGKIMDIFREDHEHTMDIIRGDHEHTMVIFRLHTLCFVNQ